MMSPAHLWVCKLSVSLLCHLLKEGCSGLRLELEFAYFSFQAWHLYSGACFLRGVTEHHESQCGGKGQAEAWSQVTQVLRDPLPGCAGTARAALRGDTGHEGIKPRSNQTPRNILRGTLFLKRTIQKTKAIQNSQEVLHATQRKVEASPGGPACITRGSQKRRGVREGDKRHGQGIFPGPATSVQ